MFGVTATATPRGVELQVETPRGLQQGNGPPSNRIWPAPIPLAESAGEGRGPLRSMTEGDETPRKHLTFSQTQLNIPDSNEEQLRRTQEAVIGWASVPTVQIADTQADATAQHSNSRPIQTRRSLGSVGGNSPRPAIASPLGIMAAGARNSNTGSVAASLFGFPDEDPFRAPSRQQSERVRLWLTWLRNRFQARFGNWCCGDEEDWEPEGLKQEVKWKLPVIMPHNQHYQYWWFFTMFIALATAALDPYRMAFQESAGLYPYNDVWACLEYIGLVIFVIDIVTKFFLAYRDRVEGIVTDHKRIAAHYMRWMFWVDVVSTFPIDGVAAAALGLQHRSESQTASLLGLVRWLRVARLYRIFDLFELLEHKMVVSQVTLILLRNNMYAIYTTHWMGCLFYWLATYEDNTGGWSWISRHKERWDGQSTVARYIYSVYFSVSAFAGLGDGDFYIATPMESFIMILYLLFNIVLQAYILGTITMVMVKGDEKSTMYRHRMEALSAFAETNALPDGLTNAMKEHLELQFLRDSVSDEQVLADYPATLRRKALRHLYAHCLGGCMLFRGLRGRFLDQLLVGCRCELFMPQVSLLSEGDVVSELMIVVDGEARGVPMGHNHPELHKMRTSTNLAVAELVDMTHKFAAAAARRKSIMHLASQGSGAVGSGGFSGHHAAAHSQASMASSGDNHMSVVKPKLERCHIAMRSQASDGSAPSAHGPSGHGVRHSVSFSRLSTRTGMSTGVMWDAAAALDGTKLYGPCDTIGAVPFFTDTSSVESVYTTSVTRVLILTKSVFDTLTQNYPQQIRTLLENLRDSTEEEFIEEVEAANADNTNAIDPAKLRAALSANSSFTAGKAHTGAGGMPLPAEARIAELAESLPPDKKQRLLQLDVLRKNVGDFFRKQKAMRVYEFLLAAAAGDLQTIRNMLQQGFKPGSMDYDHRNALMVASHEGQDAVVRLLLAFQSPLDVKDAFGNTALMSALKQGHDHVVALLLQAGAPLGMEPEAGFAVLARAVTDGDLHQLRRFLTVGVDAKWAGYDGTTALHLAAAEGNLAAVELLVDIGDAQVSAKDRRGITPLDEAQQGGHTAVVEYLTQMVEQQSRDEELKQQAEQFVQDMQRQQRSQAGEHHTTFMIGTRTDSPEPTPFSPPQPYHTTTHASRRTSHASGVLGPEASSPSVSEKARRQALHHATSVSSSPRRSLGSYRGEADGDEITQEIMQQLAGKNGRRRSSLHSHPSRSPPSTTQHETATKQSPKVSNSGQGNVQYTVSGSGLEPLPLLDSPASNRSTAVQVAGDVAANLGVFGSAMLQRLSPPGHSSHHTDPWAPVGQKPPPQKQPSGPQGIAGLAAGGQPLAESHAASATVLRLTEPGGAVPAVVPPLDLKALNMGGPAAETAAAGVAMTADLQVAADRGGSKMQRLQGIATLQAEPTGAVSADIDSQHKQGSGTQVQGNGERTASGERTAASAGVGGGLGSKLGNSFGREVHVPDLPTPSLSVIGSARTQLHKQATKGFSSPQNSGALNEPAKRSGPRAVLGEDRNSARLSAADSFRMSTLQTAAPGAGTARRSATGATPSNLAPTASTAARTSLPHLSHPANAAAVTTAGVSGAEPAGWPTAQAKTLQPIAGSGVGGGDGDEPGGSGAGPGDGAGNGTGMLRPPAVLPMGASTPASHTQPISSSSAGTQSRSAKGTAQAGGAASAASSTAGGAAAAAASTSKASGAKKSAKEGAGQKLLGGVTRSTLK